MQAKPEQERFTVYLPSHIVSQVRAIAAARRWSLSVAAEEVIAAGLPSMATPKASTTRRTGRAA